MRDRHDGDRRRPRRRARADAENRLAAASIEIAARLRDRARRRASARRHVRSEGQQRLAVHDVARLEPQLAARRIMPRQLAGRERRLPWAVAAGRTRRGPAEHAIDLSRGSAPRPQQRCRLAETGTMRQFDPDPRRSAIQDRCRCGRQVGQHVRRRGRRDVARAIGRRRRDRPSERAQHRRARPDEQAPAPRCCRGRRSPDRRPGSRAPWAAPGSGARPERRREPLGCGIESRQRRAAASPGRARSTD